MIYRVPISKHYDVIRHAVTYGIATSTEYIEPYFKVTTDVPFPDEELANIGFEVWSE